MSDATSDFTLASSCMGCGEAPSTLTHTETTFAKQPPPDRITSSCDACSRRCQSEQDRHLRQTCTRYEIHVGQASALLIASLASGFLASAKFVVATPCPERTVSQLMACWQPDSDAVFQLQVPWPGPPRILQLVGCSQTIGFENAVGSGRMSESWRTGRPCWITSGRKQIAVNASKLR